MIGNGDFPKRFSQCPRLDHKLPTIRDQSHTLLTVVTFSCADKSQNKLQSIYFHRAFWKRLNEILPPNQSHSPLRRHKEIEFINTGDAFQSCPVYNSKEVDIPFQVGLILTKQNSYEVNVTEVIITENRIEELFSGPDSVVKVTVIEPPDLTSTAKHKNVFACGKVGPRLTR